MLKSSKSASPDFIVLLGSMDNTYCPVLCTVLCTVRAPPI